MPKFVLSSKKFSGRPICSASARSTRVPSWSSASYKPVAGCAELGNLRRPQVRRHHVGVLRIARNLAADVPELLQIRIARILRRFDAERRVAARAAAAGEVVLHLRRRSAARRSAGTRRTRDRSATDAMPWPLMPAEAPFAVRGAELGDERVAVGCRSDAMSSVGMRECHVVRSAIPRMRPRPSRRRQVHCAASRCDAARRPRLRP